MEVSGKVNEFCAGGIPNAVIDIVEKEVGGDSASLHLEQGRHSWD